MIEGNWEKIGSSDFNPRSQLKIWQKNRKKNWQCFNPLDHTLVSVINAKDAPTWRGVVGTEELVTPVESRSCCFPRLQLPPRLDPPAENFSRL